MSAEMDAGQPGIFPLTHWSLVRAAGDELSPGATAALERLCADYREPVRRCLLASGVPPGDAEDVTQSFFESLLRRKSFSKVAPERGRFRTYLKRALRYHLLDRPKALPAGLRVELDSMEEDERQAFEPGEHRHPGDALDRAWAEQVLHLAYERLAARHATGAEAEGFRVLSRFLAEEPGPGDYAALAEPLGVAPNTLAKRVQRLREELAECVRAELLETVGTPSEVEAEVRALFG
jgi:RNA polymerase sigma factor (sigma-70 family)